MKMRKLSKHELRQVHNGNAYDELNELYNLQKFDTFEKQVHELVLRANDVLTQICTHADMIKIDIYELLKEDLPTFYGTDKCIMSSNTWKDFVSLAAQVEKSGLNERVSERIIQSEKESGYTSALTKSFIDNYLSGDSMKFPEQEDIVAQPTDIDTFISPYFDKSLVEAIQIRHKLNDELWPLFRKHAMAAEHITGIEYKDFKDLVDWEHYKLGGYPSEKSKPKFWAIIEKADRAIRLLKKYEFEQGDAIPKSFGWNLDINEHHVAYQFHSDVADEWKKYDIIIPYTPTMRLKMGLLETDIIISLPDDICVIVDRATRDVRSVVKKQELINRLPVIFVNTNEDPYFKNAKLDDVKGFDFEIDKITLSPMTLQFLPELIDLGLGNLIENRLTKLYRPTTQTELNILGAFPYYFYSFFKKPTI